MPKKDKKQKIAIITLIQEGAAKVGGEHAMMFPYVEQAIKAANTIKEKVTVIPYIISPKPERIEKLPRVTVLKEKMKKTNGGKMILVKNGAGEPYGHPWNWEKYGHEAHKEIITLIEKEELDGIIIMAHGFASVPAVLDLTAAQKDGKIKDIPIQSFAVTHSTFDEHKDVRPQRRLFEREIHNHAKMIAISPYMAEHLQEMEMVSEDRKPIPLYNALPKDGWFSTKIPRPTILNMLHERNQKVSEGPFYGVKLPIKDILSGKKELVLYFGRPQKYVKGTDAVIACAKQDQKRHYMLICSGSEEELEWHLELIDELENVTLAWEHNSKLVLGTVQLTENNPDARITALFLSRREPMGLVSREVVLMQDEGSVLPVVSDNCGFEDPWQKEYSFVVTNPCIGEEENNKDLKQKMEDEIYVSPDCVKETLEILDKISQMEIIELRKRVQQYAEKIKENYSEDRYWAFYLQAIALFGQDLERNIEEKLAENRLEKIPNV